MSRASGSPSLDIHETSLCERCNKLHLRRYLAPVKLRLFDKLPDIIALGKDFRVSTSSKCALCRALASCLPPAAESGTQHVIPSLRFEILGDTETFQGSLTESLCLVPGVKGAQRLIILGLDAYRLGAKGMTYGRLLNPTQVDRVLVKSWINKCKLQHQRCKQSRVKVETGSRKLIADYVIDVLEMCLHKVEEDPISYLILSYVWGEVPTVRLLEDNLIAFQQPGSLDRHSQNMAPVIMDAIKFTKAIDMRYLWVDVLCICQDDESSKWAQISSMNLVYAQAFLTLVALDTDDASGRLHGSDEYGVPRHQALEVVQELRTLPALPSLDTCLERSTWRTRAWTFQEEHFSKRLLYFSKDQAYFRCQEQDYCEDRHEQSEAMKFAPEARGGLLAEHQRLDDLRELWMELSEAYTKRNFSRAEDRHNAFAGIENELRQKVNSYPCLLGIPFSQLARQLCWQHDMQANGLDTIRIQQYPSWSWCGWTGAIVFPKRGFRSTIDRIFISRGATQIEWTDAQFSGGSGNFPSTAVTPIESFDRGESILRFTAPSCRLRVITKETDSINRVLILSSHGMICGMIHGSLTCTFNSDDDYEFVLIGLGQRPPTFDTCAYHKNDPHDFRRWFRNAPQDRTQKMEDFNEIAERMAPPVAKWSDNPMSAYEARLADYNNLDLKTSTSDRLSNCCEWMLGILLKVCYALVKGVGIFVAFWLVILVCLVALPTGVMLLVLYLLLIAAAWAYQTPHNRWVKHSTKWCLWDAFATTRLGKWIDNRMPGFASEFIYPLFSNYASSDERAREQKRIDKEKELEASYNVVCIMLIQATERDGQMVSERRAVGEMSRKCWERSNPAPREIVLR